MFVVSKSSTLNPVPMPPPFSRATTIQDFLNLKDRIGIVAHRGVIQDDAPPENTLAAYEYAIDSGVDMIELDVRQTQDGVLVIYHDEKLKGKKISEYTLSEFKAIEIEGHTLPTFEEMLDTLKGRVLIDIEVKNEDLPLDVVQQIVSQVSKTLEEKNMTEETFISSFSTEVIEESKKFNPLYKAFFIYSPTLHGEDPISYLHELQAEGIVVRQDLLKPNWVSLCHDMGYPISVYGVNDYETFEKCRAFDVHSMMSDHPEKLNEWVSRA